MKNRMKPAHAPEEPDDHRHLAFISRTMEEITDFPADTDVYAYVAWTFREITPPGTVILVNSINPEDLRVTLEAYEGAGEYLPAIERALGRPLLGISFPIPPLMTPPLRMGTCDELEGGLRTITFGGLPETVCREIEQMPFFGKVYGTGISWKGTLHGVVTFILPPGHVLEHQGLITLFIRQVAGFLQRRQAETRLLDQYATLQAIIESPESPIFSVDTEYRYTTFNSTHAAVMKALYGATIMLGKSLLEYQTVPEDRAAAKKNLDRALSGEEVIEQAYSGENLKTRLFFEVSHSPVRDARGTVTGVAVYARDITRKRLAELALQESEATAWALMNATTETALLIDPDGVILAANTTTARRLGHTVGEILGKNVFSLMPADLAESRHARIATAISSGNPVQFEDVRAGRIFENNVYPVKDEDGNVFRCAIYAREITERKLAEEALRLANRKLNLLSSITRHDIRNQVMALSAYLEISKDSLHDPVQTAGYIAKEERIADAIATQISFTKDYEKLGVQDPVWQNVRGIIRNAAGRLPLCSVRIDAGDPALEIFADPLLEKVFYNLIDNALRHGGDTMTLIRVTSRKEKNNLIIRVEDDGVGIAEADRNQLFRKGFGKNTGLGLYLSREILSITGMTITENGEPGKGARFEITVPERQYRFLGNR